MLARLLLGDAQRLRIMALMIEFMTRSGIVSEADTVNDFRCGVRVARLCQDRTPLLKFSSSMMRGRA